jgi:multidrug efflux system outer membrane protein
VVPLGEQYREAPAVQQSLADVGWWEFVSDPILKEHIRGALEANRDRKIALFRIDEARAILGVTRPDQFPRLDYVGNARRTDASDAALVPAPAVNDFGLLGQLSFEVDLWGRYASATEAQRAQLLSTEYAYRAITLSLVSQVAIAYLQLLDLDRQIAIAERTLANRRQYTRVNEERFKGGYIAKLDLNQAQVQEYEAAAALAALQRALRQTENALSVLKGTTPTPIQRADQNSNPLAAVSLPAGFPAMLLERRPDVRASEESARAAVMRVGIARAQQYPALNLTGFIGLNSGDQSELFSQDARTWGLTGTLLGPLFNFGKNWARVDAAEAQADQSIQAYEGTVLQAVREVEDALIGIKTFDEEHTARVAQVEAASSGARLSRRRYDDGVTSYLEVLDTERSLFGAELARSNSEQRYLSAIVQLYKALGGGWQEEGKSEATAR